MPRLRSRDTRSPSKLESRLLFLWQLAKGPPLERQFRFHAARRWRAHFTYLRCRISKMLTGEVEDPGELRLL